MAAADGALAHLVAVPLGFVVAWVAVLITRRRHQPNAFKPFRRDRKLVGWLLLAGVLTIGVVVTSLSSPNPPPTVVFATGPSADGNPARAATPATRKQSPRTAAFSGYSPSDRPTYSCSIDGACEPGIDHVVFNSYVNAVNYGDERAFFDAKPASDPRSGGFEDVLNVKPGDRVIVRVYINNNADALSAKATVLTMLLPTSQGRRLVAAASISAQNASPKTAMPRGGCAGRRAHRGCGSRRVRSHPARGRVV